MPYEDGAKTLFLYTKGTKGNVPEELRQLLKYMEDSSAENAKSEGLKALHRILSQTMKRRLARVGSMNHAHFLHADPVIFFIGMFCPADFFCDGILFQHPVCSDAAEPQASLCFHLLFPAFACSLHFHKQQGGSVLIRGIGEFPCYRVKCKLGQSGALHIRQKADVLGGFLHIKIVQQRSAPRSFFRRIRPSL